MYTMQACVLLWKGASDARLAHAQTGVRKIFTSAKILKWCCTLPEEEEESRNENGESESRTAIRVNSKDLPREGSVEQLRHNGDQRDTNSSRQNSDKNTPFDQRPLKNIAFPRPNSYEVGSLAHFVVDSLIKNNYCVIDNVFEDSNLTKVLHEISELEEKSLFQPGQLSGGRTSGNEKLKVTETGIRSDKIMWVEGNETYIPHISNVVQKMDAILTAFSSIQSELCINGRTKAMVACYPGNGTYYRRHVDNPNKDGRVMTCILYLNKDWNVQEDGGLLRIFEGHSEEYHDIPPLYNRLLFFWSDHRNPHEVQPAKRTRYALTVWYFDQEERQKAKDEEKAQEMFRLGGEQLVKDLHRMEIEKKQLTDRIEDESVKAVQSLSEEELKALADVVKDHPEPRDALSQLGISSKIQDILLQKLSIQ